MSATVLAVLAYVQPARAEDPPPAATTTPAETTPADAPAGGTSTAPTTTSEPPPAPTATDQPAQEPAPSAEPPPSTSTDTSTATQDSTPAATSDPATSTTPTTPAAPSEPVVTIQDGPAPPAPPPPAAPAPPAPAPVVDSTPVVIVIVLAAATAPPAEPAPTPPDQTLDSAAEAIDTSPVVSFALHSASAVVAMVTDRAPTATPALSKPAPAAARMSVAGLLRQVCVRPKARVPLSQRCMQARAGLLSVAQLSAPSPEVRAAIDRAAARATARPVEARSPPGSKAAKKRPVVNARPTIPFGWSGQGAAHDPFSGATGSGSTSRLFALAATPLRVPLPFRFARIRLPSTRPTGLVAAPPTARPG